MNLLGRMLMLLLSTALLSFFAFCLLYSININEIYNQTILNGKMTGEKTAKFTEEFAVEQATKHLMSLALEKARRMEIGMSEIKYDAESIAKQMTQILSDPDKYKEISLPNHNDKPIYSGEVYIHYAPEVERNGITSELKHEVGISSNIVDMLKVISSFYFERQTSSYIGSKNGYLICIDTLPDKKGEVIFTDDFKENYDPRERPWYKEAEKEQKTVITDFYTAADGYLAVTFASPYYNKEGFAGVAAVGASLESLYKQLTEDSIENTNICFALNHKGEVVLSSTKTGTFAVSKEHRDLRDSKDISLAKEAVNMASGTSNIALVTVEGKEYYLAYAPMPSIGWSFGTLIERDEVIEPANKAKDIVIKQSESFKSSMNSFYRKHKRLILLSLVILIIILFFVSVIVSKRAISPILALKDGVKEIAKGNLDKKLEIKTGDEIEALSNSINDMSSDLKKYMENLSKITAEKERIATELNVARNIQAGMLPSVEPNFSNKKEFDLAASMNPAKEVGGDFYDFYKLDDNHLAITVADVSGKGVGAALFMMISKTVLKNCAMLASSAYSEGREPDLALIMEQANQQLTENNKEFMFVTVFFGVLDLKTGNFAYVNAGHNPPLVYHRNEDEFSFMRNKKKNRVMGVRKNTKYQVNTMMLSSCDKLFFYTDGITEAMDEKRELFGETRLKSALETLKDVDKADVMLSKVYDAVKSHVGNAEQSDDMTMLGLVYK